MNIGFFGVGNMGGPMAANLVKAGHTVTAFDLVPDLLKTVEADGVAVAADPAAAVAGANHSPRLPLKAGVHINAKTFPPRFDMVSSILNS